MIAIDAMGGDFAPKEVVVGALHAARLGIGVMLYGDNVQLEAILNELDAQWQTWDITIHDCSQVVGMGDEPSRTVLQKKDSSLVRAIQAVAEGHADAFFSAGNSGAVLVAATLLLGRVEGVLRPAIGDFLPSKKGSIFCVDLGANTDTKAEYLEQFALMGHLYVKLMHGVDMPRVALLSNGHEPYKGSLAVKAAYKQLEQSALINFIGNLESRDMFDDKADVLVCDGFTGNILLKSMQGTARTIMQLLHRELTSSWTRKLGTFFCRGAFKSVARRLDYAKKGGALLLGVRKPVVIGHGCSHVQAITQGIRFTHAICEQQFLPLFNEELVQLINQQSNPGVVRKIRSLFKGART